MEYIIGVDIGGTLISYSGAISTVAYSIAPAVAFRIVGGWGLPTLFVSGVAAAAFGLLAAVLIPSPREPRPWPGAGSRPSSCPNPSCPR